MNAEERLVKLKDHETELLGLCFDYFYWFSRFEFAMKENRFAQPGRYGEAKPDWKKFIGIFSKSFEVTEEAALLLASPPETQMCRDYHCEFEATNLDREETELGKVTLVLRTIRNNLFHGGKGGQKDWDNPDRNVFLLKNGKAVLDALARLADLEADYLRMY